MLSPAEMLKKINGRIKPEWKTAFFWAFALGLFIHLPVMTGDIPNHDGLDSMYFDQNMITSGRWFLMIACGFSSFYTLPWLIGLLGLCFLGLTAAALTELFKLQGTVPIALVSGLLVSFPALASTFAYVFTMDGYMLALLLSVLAVLFTKKYRFGFLPGGVCLAFSLGTYQAYLAVAMLLCIYSILELFIEEASLKAKMQGVAAYLGMGITGAGLYYVILQVLLKIQGKELASYQGINGMGGAEAPGLIESILNMYRDFAAFTVKGGVLYNGPLSAAALLLLSVVCIFVIAGLCIRRKWWKKPSFFVIIALLILMLPLVSNVILFISPDVTYHLLMRYQWVVYLIVMVAIADRYGRGLTFGSLLQWGMAVGALVLIVHYAVTDNIGYSNLQKRYEKTYAYCVRLLDRIEQTEGYYQGIPIAMVGVVGDRQFPVTDITGNVTAGMIGLGGDSLVYTGSNYQAFIKHYLGATLNFLPPEAMEDIYESPEYVEMESFPGRTSTRVVDGIMYVKTENTNH